MRARKQSLTIVPMKLGRKPKLGPRCVRRLVNFVKKNNTKPLFAIAAQFRALHGVHQSAKLYVNIYIRMVS